MDTKKIKLHNSFTLIKLQNILLTVCKRFQFKTEASADQASSIPVPLLLPHATCHFLPFRNNRLLGITYKFLHLQFATTRYSLLQQAQSIMVTVVQQNKDCSYCRNIGAGTSIMVAVPNHKWTAITIDISCYIKHSPLWLLWSSKIMSAHLAETQVLEQGSWLPCQITGPRDFPFFGCWSYYVRHRKKVF